MAEERITEQIISLERLEETASLFGAFDSNMRILEQELSVRVVNREESLKVSGEAENVMLAVRAIRGLLDLATRGEELNEQNVRYVLQLVLSGGEAKLPSVLRDVICVTAAGKPIKAKTLGQKA